MNDRMRSLSFAIAGVGFLALLDSALSLYQTHGPKEHTGPPEKLTIAISSDMNPVLVTPIMFAIMRGLGSQDWSPYSPLIKTRRP